jgi:hypothetical protein
MHNFSFALCGLLKKYGKTTEDLASAVGFPFEVIEDWRYGRNVMIAPRQLITIARAFATSKKDACANHLDLLYSHLQDDCWGPGAKYINIEVLPKALPFVAQCWGFRPTRRRSELDLEAIRKHIWYDTNLQKQIRDIASPLKSKPVPDINESTLYSR